MVRQILSDSSRFSKAFSDSSHRMDKVAQQPILKKSLGARVQPPEVSRNTQDASNCMTGLALRLDTNPLNAFRVRTSAVTRHASIL